MSTVKRWTEGVGARVSGLRFSGLTVLVVVLTIAGALIVSPSVSTFVQQRREISELRASVDEKRKAVSEMDDARAKWKDPVYVRSQARDRLFYVMPGETQLNVIEDIVMPAENDEATNAELSRIDRNWAEGLTASFLSAGVTSETPEQLDGGTDSGDQASDQEQQSTDPEQTDDSNEENAQ